MKIYLILCLALMRLQSWAQDDGDDFDMPDGRGLTNGLEGGEDFVDYQAFRFSISDILMVVLLIVACYVFGKIWRGCTYLILALAAIFYFMLH